ncbi:hypothetical protein BP5796_08012 [Coleophoma crateriformis]|uniref:Ribosomal RNA methyltransferase FtsJ domain-containing protein n=1 Tax=Coleophoma crateriformis TaxID=565419 RepID=A0A3D8RDH8_9HELO|nr:hypothetical protein BP5796_08012 [Coleophoma crateriformis]
MPRFNNTACALLAPSPVNTPELGHVGTSIDTTSLDPVQTSREASTISSLPGTPRRLSTMYGSAAGCAVAPKMVISSSALDPKNAVDDRRNMAANGVPLSTGSTIHQPKFTSKHCIRTSSPPPAPVQVKLPKYKANELYINELGQLVPYQEILHAVSDTSANVLESAVAVGITTKNASVSEPEVPTETDQHPSPSGPDLLVTELTMEDATRDYVTSRTFGTPTDSVDGIFLSKDTAAGSGAEKPTNTSKSQEECQPSETKQTPDLPNLFALTITPGRDRNMADLERPVTDFIPRIMPANRHLEGCNRYVYDFLMAQEPEYARVADYRARGWQNEKGDEVFKRQREKADTTGPEGEKAIFKIMMDIGEELQAFANIYLPQVVLVRPLIVLDLCMAPGGYSAIAMRYNALAEVYGITLPPQQGGHPVNTDVKARVKGLKFCDLTMIAGEFTNQKIPEEHPEYKSFNRIRPFSKHKFDLIFCDGNVLRTHQRPEYRKQREIETLRLNCSQLILALQRVHTHGTLVMLLHKVDYWDSLHLIYSFSKFADVSLFKPCRAFKARGSFYMIAKNIRPEDPAAQEVIRSWKEMWWRATCGEGQDLKPVVTEHKKEYVLKVLEEFGERFIELARPVWKIQADGLSKTAYAGDGSSFEAQKKTTNVDQPDASLE